MLLQMLTLEISLKCTSKSYSNWLHLCVRSSTAGVHNGSVEDLDILISLLQSYLSQADHRGSSW
jgi:hypothetical protein